MQTNVAKKETGSKEELLDIVEDCENARFALCGFFTKWENDFLDSVIDHIADGGVLTDAQEDTLRDLRRKL